jgi:hypothetical protein
VLVTDPTGHLDTVGAQEVIVYDFVLKIVDVDTNPVVTTGYVVSVTEPTGQFVTVGAQDVMVYDFVL